MTRWKKFEYVSDNEILIGLTNDGRIESHYTCLM